MKNKKLVLQLVLFLICVFTAPTAQKPGRGLRAGVAMQTLFTIPYLEFREGFFTGLAVSNVAGEDVTIRYTAYDGDGNMADFPNNPAEFPLPNGTQLARQASEIFETEAGTELIGWVELSSSGPLIGSFFQFGSFDLRELDGSTAFQDQASHFYLDRVFEGPTAFRGQPATTTISLVNPNPDPVELELHLRSSQVETESLSRMLPAKGMLHGTISELFGDGGALEVDQGYVEVEVTSGAGAVGFELIQLESEKTVIGLNAQFGNPTDTATSAQMASDVNIFTDVNVINTSSETRTLQLRWLNEGGSPGLPPISGLVLEPGEQFSGDAAEAFSLAEGRPLVGTLVMIADGDGVIGDVIFGEPTTFTYAAALPLQSRAFSRAVFSQIGEIPGVFFTGLAFRNPSDEAVAIQLEVHQPDGTLLGTSGVIALEGLNRTSFLLSEKVPEALGQAGGYVIIQSDFPIIGQLIFGGLEPADPSQFTLFSAVPPTVIE